MKGYLAVLMLPVVLLAFSSCKKIKGKGDVITETRNLTGFTGIEVSLPADLFYTPDSVWSVQLIAQENILEIIESPVEGGIVVFKVKNRYTLGKHEPIQIFIHAPGINQLDVSGSGNIHQLGVWKGTALQTDISGSGHIELNYLEATEIVSLISGSGNSNAISGMVSREYLSISGSGSFDYLGILADTVYATISGSGNMTVTAGKLLDATISGSGNIRYQGEPIVKTHITGSGTVTHL